MILGPVFERFVNSSPMSVMARAAVEHALCASARDDLFDRTAERGYSQELLFSTQVVPDRLQVVGGRLGPQHAHDGSPRRRRTSSTGTSRPA